MNHLSELRAACRARWLADLSAALDDAQILLSRLVGERIDQADVDLLRTRVDELRSELHALHRRGFGSSQRIEIPRPLHPGWRPLRN